MPLLSVCAAFSFVIMMFNLPLPGGTTGHAVGMGVTAIVLGPWASILALSIALLVQAVFFGDGGITAYGANCFNMAIVGSLVAHAVYRGLAGGSARPLRRSFAAALAGYAAINTAAFCAAVEFGLQPLLFHDASGTPLYAPYPLGVAIPAMMLGHLTFAGLAEGILTAGVLAWLQHSDPALLKFHEPADGGWRIPRVVWVGLAALLIATPLGLLAKGTAWGEWGVEDFQSPGKRHEIAAASQQVVPPQTAPSGMQRLAALWKPALPDYTVPFLKSEQIGYVLSAMLGTGLILAATLATQSLLRALKRRENAPPTP